MIYNKILNKRDSQKHNLQLQCCELYFKEIYIFLKCFPRYPISLMSPVSQIKVNFSILKES